MPKPQRKIVMRGSLHRRTLELLKASPLSTFDVATATGLTYSWVAAFAADLMADPSVNKVQALYEFLTKSKLAV
jgi:hypothetical protein